MRSSIPVVALVAWSTACSTPDREFPSDDGTTSSTATSTGSTPATSTSGGPGGGGGGTGGDASSNSSSSQGGGDPEDCGNSVVDPGEDCDDDTDLCDGCQLACPSGWTLLGDSCFAVALGGDLTNYDAFAADAMCGALGTATTAGHRAHGATPDTLDEIDELGALCPAPGCWLGFYAFGPPGEQIFTSAATGESLVSGAPVVAEGLGGDLCLKLLLNTGGGSGSRGVLDDEPCTSVGYFACELDRSYGDFSTCNDGIVDEAEECDGGDGELCVDCDRQCRTNWIENPRTHTCLLALGSLATWSGARDQCIEAGGRLASPDQVADFRVASAITGDAWLGIEADGITVPPPPAWSSGETFDYEPGAYPLPAGPTDVSNGALVDDEIVFDLPEAMHDALCEQLDPDA